MSTIFVLDQQGMAESLAVALYRQGHVVYVSHNHWRALLQIIGLAAERKAPDLVVAELLEVDGQKLCQELRRLDITRQIKVVLMCRQGPHTTIDHCRALAIGYGANDYLPKTDDPRAIAKKIQRLM